MLESDFNLSCWAQNQPGYKTKIRVNDSSGKEWEVNDWEGGTRPYLKNLKDREADYVQKWGNVGRVLNTRCLKANLS